MRYKVNIIIDKTVEAEIQELNNKQAQYEAVKTYFKNLMMKTPDELLDSAIITYTPVEEWMS